MFSIRKTRLAALTVTLATAGLLTSACTTSPDTATTTPTATPSVKATAEAALSITDPWIKATDTGMTAAFGTLVNHTDQPLTIVGATSSLSVMELHEMVMQDGKMIMQPKKGGFVLPAKGTHELSPGGDHLMFMSVTSPIKAGDEVTVTLELSDGTKFPFTAVGKPFSGAEESYAPDAGMPMGSDPTPSA
ncbi:copper chaperone PCu(A)C [Cryptosporangium phraense]|uniref:Copper chaperone PCu(A)C n=1 Tax=Cryptosporangium phraense TaxID=2593070 RepID=A0A545ANZ4_9ACTN|nr:copper chaperone PCu(A)C [Cryptosporangium phraense]TQS42971.1 copper chaperone PCu(A)C [Cryptosporangium phraense]